MQLKEVALTKLDKNNDQIQKTFLINTKILYVALQLVSFRHVHTMQYHFSSSNTY